MKKKILALIIAAQMLAGLTACGDDTESTAQTNASGSVSEEADDDNNTESGDGSWNIFVYLCGSDLESNYGMASGDIQEMIDSSCGENVKFIVETGGSSTWQQESVPTDKLGRFEISGGEITPVENVELSSMGDSDTLTDFLNWGAENYPSDKKGLILWNHGGGSGAGVCFDELVTDDKLTVSELDESLSAASENTGEFEFIGFDACLMGSLEAANMLSKYSNYMIGSEETEPGYGWNYQTMGEYLTNNPECSGAEVGQTICDGFYDMCKSIGKENQATLAVVDLSKVGEISEKFNEYFKQVYENAPDVNSLVELVRVADYADNFGGNNKNEGYTNMADLAGIIDCSSDLANGGEELKQLIDSAVPYKICGSDHTNACGISIYFPYAFTGNENVNAFNDVCTIPYYMAFVNKMIYATVNAGDISGFDDSAFLSEAEEQEDIDYSDDTSSGSSDLIKFEKKPALDENGTYSCKLTADSLELTVDALGLLAMMSEDNNNVVILGYSNDAVKCNWETGEFTDNFDGTWFSLPDGQLLSVYPVEKTTDYAIYTAPVKLNGEETNLRIKYNLSDSSAEIIGVWDGISENGASARDTKQLKNGDKITPVYYYMAVGSEDELTMDGTECVYSGDNTIYYSILPDGNYLYGFSFDDFCGDSLVTDMTAYTVNGDNIGFIDISDS